MVLNYLGVIRSQSDLARQLGTRPNIGTPHRNLKQLQSSQIDVLYTVGDLNSIRRYIEQEHPVIVFVQASELPYWRGQISRHALVVIAADDVVVMVLDPAMPPDLISVSTGDFMLAWDEMDNTYAVIRLHKS